MIEGGYMNILGRFEMETTNALPYEEAEQRYYTEQYPLLMGFDEYNTEDVYASTLDEYLMLLVKGHVNVSLRTGLEMHLMDLLEDEWFYQWPLIHWAYGSNLLRGVGCRKNVKRAVDILLPMARNDCPSALYDIGDCYMYGWGVETSYTKAIYCWVKAWQKGFHPAIKALKEEYWLGRFEAHEEIPTDLKLAVVYEVIQWIMSEKNLKESDNSLDKLNNYEQKMYKKLAKQMGQLETKLEKEMPLRVVSKLFYDDDNNPYKIKI